MKPEAKRKSAAIDEILAEIDQRPFIQTLTTIVSEVSPKTNLSYIHKVIRQAVRCACLIDLYAETGDPSYEDVIEKQRSKFYQLVPENFHPELKKIENDVKRFFDDERMLRRKISIGDKFTEEDIKNYLLGKSGDNLFYGRVLELLVPEWNLTNELRIQTMLFDMGKDLLDYPNDVKSGLPNVLSMYLSSGINKRAILQLATELKGEAFTSPNINVSPTLKEAIKRNYSLIVQRLEL